MPESKVVIRPGDTSCFKEAVCIDAERIYDSCSDKDCLEDLLEWLNTASNFKWSNHSVSADNPFNTKTKTALKEQLTQQIRGCNAIIVVSGMYTLYSEWIDYEINEAIRMNKPIIAIKPWGNERVPLKIQNNATVLVGWNSASLISTIRNYAL